MFQRIMCVLFWNSSIVWNLDDIVTSTVIPWQFVYKIRTCTIIQETFTLHIFTILIYSVQKLYDVDILFSFSRGVPGNSVRLKCPRQLSSISGTRAQVSLILKGLSVTPGPPPISIDRTICRPVPAWNSNISSLPACSSPLSYKVLHRLWN